MTDKLTPTQKPVQPSPNNGGEEVSINKSTGNVTKQPGTGAKSEPGWKGYGKMP